MGERTGKPKSLESFNWRFGEGTAKNASCCGYILQACKKANLLEVAAEVIPVLEDSDSDLLADLDEKITEWLQTVPIQA